ncbi:hypothetical protein JGH11_18465, partial [Dysgonomonas sp. Marseille-P4677]|uniref:hypothetical protein n=1 Tax=Dysgonomonas sp. Marseille-P4677 TaxID=2364790 RepID=UPI0019145787
DSIEQSKLKNSLTNFLLTIKNKEKTNKWISPDNLSETQILLDEIQGFVNNDTLEFMPHWINCELLPDKTSYSIQVAYISLSESQPLLRAIFEFIAYKKDDNFLFASPLKRNTKEWKTKTEGHLIFHYQNNIAENVINQYIKIVNDYDQKLGINPISEFYFCDNCQDMTSLLRLTGITYNMAYNGFSWNMTDFKIQDRIIALYGQNMSRQEIVDPHDVFHGRASIAIPQNLRNHYMVCGCAYVYGGSWGISWDNIKKMFKEKMSSDKNADWQKLYFDRFNFGESQEKHLLVTQFINALIIEKVEKEQGFSAVLKLLSSGNMYKEKDKFFEILKAVTGIDETNFNSEISQLINKSMKGI